MLCTLFGALLNQLLCHQLRVAQFGCNLHILFALAAAFLKVFGVIAHDVLDLFPRQLVLETRFQLFQIFLLIQLPHLSKYR